MFSNIALILSIYNKILCINNLPEWISAIGGIIGSILIPVLLWKMNKIESKKNEVYLKNETIKNDESLAIERKAKLHSLLMPSINEIISIKLDSELDSISDIPDESASIIILNQSSINSSSNGKISTLLIILSFDNKTNILPFKAIINNMSLSFSNGSHNIDSNISFRFKNINDTFKTITISNIITLEVMIIISKEQINNIINMDKSYNSINLKFDINYKNSFKIITSGSCTYSLEIINSTKSMIFTKPNFCYFTPNDIYEEKTAEN